MTYSLEFDARALKEWQKLGNTVREQLKMKLTTILANPLLMIGHVAYFIPRR